jgi:asparagine synthase (glutamine-hydrolysing)
MRRGRSLMCGLATVFSYAPCAPGVDRVELEAISARLAARGPDGQGVWFDSSGRVGLAHRRLAIIDPVASANQPMLGSDARTAIVYNGEIYNFRLLREQLQRQGVELRTNSDTEVILELYRRDGEAMLRQLRGMYAMAIWDARRGAMLLARDPYGIKPLYYADDGWTLRVASQVKALLACPRVSRLPEPAGHIGLALFGSVPEPYTLWQEIRALPAGHLAWVDETGLRLPRAHWLIGDAFQSSGAGTQSEEGMLASLRDSVAHHLVADVPVGVFLSSGVDSAALLGAVSDLGRAPVTAITIGFDEFNGRAQDEVPLAREIAGQYHARHVVRRVSEEEFQADLPAILDAMDQPSIDGFNTWFAAKAAREVGLKVMLSGVGGDELFGGYQSFHDIPRWRRWFALTSAVRPLGWMLRKALVPVLPRIGLSEKAAGLPEIGGSWAGAYLLRRGVFMPWELRSLFAPEFVEEGLRRLRWPQLIAGQLPAHVRGDHGHVAAMEAGLYLRNQLLRDTDWASMAHGVEVRTPLVDAQLLNQIAHGAAQLSPGRGKRLLAKLPRPALMSQVVDRPKTGFATPLPDWMQRAPSLQAWRTHRFLNGARVQASRRLVAALLRS